MWSFDNRMPTIHSGNVFIRVAFSHPTRTESSLSGAILNYERSESWIQRVIRDRCAVIVRYSHTSSPARAMYWVWRGRYIVQLRQSREHIMSHPRERNESSWGSIMSHPEEHIMSHPRESWGSIMSHPEEHIMSHPRESWGAYNEPS